MSRTDEEIKRFETKMKSCTTMTAVSYTHLTLPTTSRV